ncbi:MAG: DoxX family membrane protein [Phycisphaerales bacterium]|jgi:uncharacterized membrane protein YphA (DoxX/SURF4 family)|nr:DoxX family membrane protein [Phycisphaerales bacterium]
MSLRQGLAMNASPVVLRLALAVVFLWAGLGKLTQTMPVTGDAAARLANMGVNLDRSAGQGSPARDPRNPAPESPIDPPESRATDAGSAMGLAMIPSFGTITLGQIEPARPSSQPTQDDPQDSPGNTPSGAQSGTTSKPSTQASSPLKTSADFPQTIEVRRVYGVALLLSKGAVRTGTKDDASPKPAIVPSAIVPSETSRVPVYLAWAAALTEVFAGAAVLVGLLTRFAGLALVFVMLTAIWLTTSGPAWQAGTARLGFIPGHDPFDGQAWTTPLMQLICLAMSLSVFLTGAGALSFDNMLFGGSAPAKPTKPAPKPEGK